MQHIFIIIFIHMFMCIVICIEIIISMKKGSNLNILPLIFYFANA
jgi:hypothetical protein